jgi:Zn-dependent protease with chaperone function
MGDRVDGWLYDGASAVRHVVRVTLDGDAFAIEGRGRIALSALDHRAGPTGLSIFARKDMPGWRLGFDAPLPGDWLERLPRTARYGSWIDRFGLIPTVGAGILFSALLLFGLWKLPEMVARLIPTAWERQLGDALVGDFQGNACTGAAGQRALDRLGATLTTDRRPMRVKLVDVPVVNAVALPGGQIVIFRGLVDQAKSADEVAGVLAHEIGHVERRHVLAAMIRQFGFGLVLGGGGKAADYAQTLLGARYSQAAEHEADLYAVDALTAAQIRAAPTAAFFARMSKGNEQIESLFAYIASHPASSERRALFAKADKRITAPRAALSPAEWQAVRTMCPASP